VPNRSLTQAADSSGVHDSLATVDLDQVAHGIAHARLVCHPYHRRVEHRLFHRDDGNGRELAEELFQPFAPDLGRQGARPDDQRVQCLLGGQIVDRVCLSAVLRLFELSAAETDQVAFVCGRRLNRTQPLFAVEIVDGRHEHADHRTGPSTVAGCPLVGSGCRYISIRHRRRRSDRRRARADRHDLGEERAGQA
jgi:hypothetical protein